MEFEINLFKKKHKLQKKDGQIFIDNRINNDQVEVINNSTIIIRQDKAVHRVEFLTYNNKEMTLLINGRQVSMGISTELDALLEALGMDSVGEDHHKEILAPMPGTIIGIPFNDNEKVESGDTLLILEAMKMENSIKSPIQGQIESIHVKVGDNVSKGQLLVSFAEK